MTGPYHIPRPILIALVVAAALGGCIDYTIGAIPIKALHIARTQMYLICIATLCMIAADREGDWLRRRSIYAGSSWRFRLGIVLLVSGAIGALALHEWIPKLKMRDAITIAYLTCAALWFAAPLLTRRHTDGSLRVSWLRWGMGLLIAYLLICLITALTGPRPQYSVMTYMMERALPVALIAGWARAAERDETFLRGSGVAVLWILGGLLLISAAINFIDLAGIEPLRAKFVEWQFVFAKAANATWEIPRRRILFPMLHFNRTAYWALIVMMLMLVAARAPDRKLRRWTALAMAALAFWIVAQTYTRGVGVAAIAGAVAWIATISRRTLIATATLGILCAMALVVAVATDESPPPGSPQPKTRSATYIEQMKTVFDPQTYRVNEPPLTSMKTRLMAWSWSTQSIRRNPILGLGYGRQNVESAYEKYVFSEGSQAARLSLSGSDEMRHVHNLWLETMAESGIPAGLALLAFSIVRWAALFAVWRRAAPRARAIAGAWLAAEFAILIAGMNFYMVKMNSGMLTMFVWAYALLWAAAALERAPEDNRT